MRSQTSQHKEVRPAAGVYFDPSVISSIYSLEIKPVRPVTSTSKFSKQKKREEAKKTGLLKGVTKLINKEKDEKMMEYSEESTINITL